MQIGIDENADLGRILICLLQKLTLHGISFMTGIRGCAKMKVTKQQALRPRQRWHSP